MSRGYQKVGERSKPSEGRESGQQDRPREDVGSVGMSAWHLVAFILVLCLFHHFYGLVCRHLLKGLFHLDLIEIMQPSPSLNLFFFFFSCPRNYINVPFVM